MLSCVTEISIYTNKLKHLIYIKNTFYPKPLLKSQQIILGDTKCFIFNLDDNIEYNF